ncbi:MinD superfamily P-loop ATPase containing an inserted ferredoxin domain [Desulfurella amilsii]|uniref:MinD superfamily P-loop ATPase containing an inserted ferredoxin domain n=1 Tax=Desulfurella amilsii TaxID=1562698 RepID=A0A1X4XYN8_9BACT|nr:ATP-binding protein [Desulfurella amilsii]OSS42662.1 MinD superfamily P-loop ATPase containing an inserted ferredoxin domain [Desulfurella amilsii]
MIVKQLAIVSGKGGTGKTTLSASFAYLAENTLMVDCDVDAPNLHIILKPKIIRTIEYFGSKKAFIDYDKCVNCGICKSVCRFEAIDFVNNAYVIRDYACEGCNACTIACPEGAISLKSVLNGKYFESICETGSMAHALLNPGEETSGGLISEVRKLSLEIAYAKKLQLIIIDGAPGIGCPATSSIVGAKYVIVVSEPTKSGFHDLERIVKTIKHFKIPHGIVINKFDINQTQTNAIFEYAKGENLEVIGAIPYDKTVEEATRKARPVIDYDCQAALAIKNIWEQTKQKLNL